MEMPPFTEFQSIANKVRIILKYGKQPPALFWEECGKVQSSQLLGFRTVSNTGNTFYGKQIVSVHRHVTLMKHAS